MGLRHGDMAGMIIPLIGIDKFQPKTGTEAEVIVVSFYIKEEQPALDLERFLEMSAVETLDTEASPNPDEDGYYLVFAEFKRDESFWGSFKLLLRDVENANGKEQWIINPFKANKLFKMNDPALNSAIITNIDEYNMSVHPEDEVTDPEYDSMLESIYSRHNLKFNAFTGPSDQMIAKYGLTESVMGTSTDYTQRILNSFVGSSCKINDVYVIETDDNITVFKRV